MSDPALPTHPVRIEFIPYDYHKVQDFLQAVRKEFGPPGTNRRWRFTSDGACDINEPETWFETSNAWVLFFHFREVNDAMIFALKYQR